MGVWGTGLYNDDIACDVRDDYKDILGGGISEPEATKQLLKQMIRPPLTAYCFHKSKKVRDLLCAKRFSCHHGNLPRYVRYSLIILESFNLLREVILTGTFPVNVCRTAVKSAPKG